MKFTMILIVSVLLEFTTRPNTAITKTILNTQSLFLSSQNLRFLVSIRTQLLPRI